MKNLIGKILTLQTAGSTTIATVTGVNDDREVTFFSQATNQEVTMHVRDLLKLLDHDSTLLVAEMLVEELEDLDQSLVMYPEGV